ncbi:CmpA/NrtA family ABC transporter substrate-binding protein [Gluconacetobacter sacchari]|uniref:CmpA/NrtA family ABC transporter substrate-binding protein n=1 Tax=Gluconacetobacter sacchari TaxID=92759 RepID=UPI0039B53A05
MRDDICFSGGHLFRASSVTGGTGAACACGAHGPIMTGGRRRFIGGLAAGAVFAGGGMGALADPPAIIGGSTARVPVERPDLAIGFVPISCAAPLIMAMAKGFFRQEGLNVQLHKTAGWALIRDRLLDGSLDGSHLLSPMPLSLSLGLGSHAIQPVRALTMQNINGQALTMALKHWKNRDPRQWKGMTFAIPFEFSMHNLLLRAYLAQYGLDPDRDVSLRVTAPPDMVANLRAGNIDGFLGPEPFNQRAVYEQAGFLHVLSADLWDGHPCCAFGVTAAFMAQYPGTYRAMQRAMIRAAYFMQDPANRLEAARIMAQPAYLNQPEIVIRQSLTGHYADGLGMVRDNPRRAGFSPYPYPSMAVWILSQFSRWGYLKDAVPCQDMAQQVFLIDEVRRQVADMGLPLPAAARNDWPDYAVMGRAFDPLHPPSYSR